ncbi:MAG: L-lysine 2,3-aminomutase (EF-P beta-lysylation pathway) [Chloroflexi bacterium]|nr:MAG: L-lysine 2,3-aminomutase (EF-P beta-lysylation pathway) [Chloroflexota bacterium]
MTIEPAEHAQSPGVARTSRTTSRPDIAPRYESINVHNFEDVPQVQALSAAQRHDIRVVAHVLPFKSNRYVVDELIDWTQAPDDPIFRLTFPHRDMLEPEAFARIDALLDAGASAPEIKVAADEIRLSLNPHPAGQLDHNVPSVHGQPLPGMQHKYRETVLFFPAQGQTCHAYCTFCFRWPQFVGLEGKKFAMREGELLRDYVSEHPEVSDVLFTGGDPLIMRTKVLETYLEPLLDGNAAANVRTIRIGTKAPGYWPQRFVTDEDAEDLLRLFRRVVASGRQLALMAHFNHPRELETAVAQEAIARIRRTGAQIRAQSPLVRHINDDSDALARMWQLQAQLGIVPYYLFVERDTGAHRYFELPLERAWQIFRGAYQQVSGVARTVRGPSMSATPGKVQILGVSEAAGEKVFVLRFLQARNPDWVGRPFFAAYDPEARWLDDLRPAFGEDEFFYEAELREMLAVQGSPWSRDTQVVPTAAGD